MANDADTSVGQSPSGDLAPARGRIPAGAPTLDFSGRRVLIAGGGTCPVTLATAEVYYPALGRWRATGSPSTCRR